MKMGCDTSVPRQALEPEDHADSRSQAATRDTEYRREDFNLRATGNPYGKIHRRSDD